MIVKKSNKIWILLSMCGILSFMASASAAAPTITLKAINNTEFAISFKEIAGIKLNDMLPENKTRDVKKDPQGLRSIRANGGVGEQKWSDFAPGINKISWRRHMFHDNSSGESKRDYGQTHAIVVFSKNDFESEGQRFAIMQVGVTATQVIQFNYKDQKIKVHITESSEPNWWVGMKEDELYYNYTITFTQQ